MNSNFKNKICAFYPVKSTTELKPVVYFNMIHNHTHSNLILNLILAGMDLSNEYFKLHLVINRSDNKTVFIGNYNLTTSEMSKKGFIKDDNITVGMFTLGPIVFDIDDSSTFSYNALLVMKDSDDNICDSSHTWFLTRPDQETKED